MTSSTRFGQKDSPPREGDDRFGRAHADADPFVLLLWAGFDWVVIAACWWTMTRFTDTLVQVACVVVVAGRIQGLGVILHDACHQPPADARRLDSTNPIRVQAWRLIEAIAGWPIGTTTAAMRYHHLRHHRNTGTPKDPYRSALLTRGSWARAALTARGVLLPAWWTLRAFVAPIALAWPRCRNAYARAFLQDRSGRDLTHHPEVVACARADLAQATAHSIAIALVLTNDLPFLTYYGLPWMLAGLLNARRVLVEHDAEEVSDHSRQAVLRATRTHDLGRLANAIVYPHNIGYHAAHHLFPTAAFTELPAIHEAYIALRS